RFRPARRVVSPVVEKLIAQAFLGNRFQKSCGNDLIGVDVVDRNDNGSRFEFHRRVLTSVTTPVIALAAAVNGLARNVRPPLPSRLSKLRLLVDTLYSPGCN